MPYTRRRPARAFAVGRLRWWVGAPRSRRGVVDLLCVLCLLALPSAGGCDRAAPSAGEPERQLDVFAGTSLREAFTALRADFERAHPGVSVTLHFAGTQALRMQVEHGAAADVFASADPVHMDALVRAGRASEPTVFAHGEPVIVVSTEAAARICALADLPSAARIVIGTPEVPIGRYTLAILDRASATLGSDFRARVEARVASRELNVRQVLTKVVLGEAEAGIVYRSDALTAADRVVLVPLPDDVNVVAQYPIAVVTGAAHPTLARAWIDLVLSADGQRALRASGFSSPAAKGPAS